MNRPATPATFHSKIEYHSFLIAQLQACDEPVLPNIEDPIIPVAFLCEKYVGIEGKSVDPYCRRAKQLGIAYKLRRKVCVRLSDFPRLFAGASPEEAPSQE